MRMVDIIHKKKHKEELTEEEIKFFIEGYTKGAIPDYQVSALLMAIWFNGMSEKETTILTKFMVESGDTIDLSFINGTKVDKHSTGGVGDKISLIVTPIVASMGVPVAKMSGRGLGHTGGTIDKLESIKGFNPNLTPDQFKNNILNHNIAITGQTGNLVPADKMLYALRDVTGTVDSIPLIASSIMSKKIASGADAIVLDVKVGSGAFMKDLESAEILARTMVNIGNNLNRKTIAILSNMDQPLGYCIGNKIEVQEVADLLQGKTSSKDLLELSIEIASQMIYLSGKKDSIGSAKEAVLNSLTNHSAYKKFLEFIEAQGGDASSIEKLNVKYKYTVEANESGYIKSIDSESVGISAMLLGAGRATKEDEIDHEVGVKLNVKVGNKVNKGDKLFEIYSNMENIENIKERLTKSVVITDEAVEAPPIIHKVIS